jgi:hypothetical protein
MWRRGHGQQQQEEQQQQQAARKASSVHVVQLPCLQLQQTWSALQHT